MKFLNSVPNNPDISLHLRYPVMSDIYWGGEPTTIYKGVETFPKSIEDKLERENPKTTISASGGSGTLQMVSEPETGRCANLLAVPQRRVDTSKDAGPQRGVDLGMVPQRGRWPPKGGGL